jgi:phosphohistidine phosphatase
MRTLLLLRHARTEDTRPGSTDRARRLTPEGERDAAALGEHVRSLPARLDLVLCSPATRARQTAEAVAAGAPLVVCDDLYDAGGEEIIAVLRELPDDVTRVLVVGHAPGLPWVANELADPDSSEAEAMATIGWRFPAGALVTMAVPGPWSELDRATLVSVRLP